MEAVASAVVLAIGMVLCFLGGRSAVSLCREALREGAEFEAEITTRSFYLRIKPVHPHEEDDDEAGGFNVIDSSASGSVLRDDCLHKDED